VSTLEKLGQLGSFVSGLVAVLALVAAVIGFTYAEGQIAVARQADLNGAFRELRRIELEHPELVEPDLEKLQADRKYRHQFEAYLSVVLSSDEEALAQAPGDKGWEKTVDDALDAYKAYLTPDYISLCQFSDELRKRIVKVAPNSKVIC